MSVLALERARALRKQGDRIGREGMSKRVIAAVAEFDGSYKGAMQLAGRLKAICMMAGCDAYWSEQIERGFMHEVLLRSSTD